MKYTVDGDKNTPQPPCWQCGEPVKPRKARHFVDGDEKAVVHKGACLEGMLQATGYDRKDVK